MSHSSHKPTFEALMLYKKAISFQEQGDAAHALKIYDRAIQLDPQFVEAYYNKGMIFLSTNKHKAAIDEFQRIIKIDPSYYYAHLNLGAVYGMLGELENSIDVYNKMLKTFKEHRIQILQGRAVTYYKLKRIKEAESDIRIILRTNPISIQARGLLLLIRISRIRSYIRRLLDLLGF